MVNFTEQHPQLLAELDKIKAKIHSELSFFPWVLGDVNELLKRTEGKYIRAAAAIAAGKAGKYNEEKHVNLCAAVELLHLATLVHDDIIDEAPLRRGQPSVQARFGKRIAVYTGDYLFTVCFKLLSQTQEMLLTEMSRAIRDICLGEIYQYSHIKNTKLTFRQYHKIISGKTAALFACAMFASAKLAELDDRQAKTMFLIGYNMGMAFQIMDDCLDYEVSQEQLKKKTCADIEEGYVTLPLLFTLRAYPKLESMYEKPLTQEDINDIIKKVRTTGLKEARRVADRYYKKARKHINDLPDYPEKQYLFDMLDFLAQRTV